MLDVTEARGSPRWLKGLGSHHDAANAQVSGQGLEFQGLTAIGIWITQMCTEYHGPDEDPLLNLIVPKAILQMFPNS